METYQEIVRRTEPKNYTVRWQMADGSENSSTYFPSFEEAETFSASLRLQEDVEDVQIYRAGRHPSASRWLSAQRTKRVVQIRNQELKLHEDAWLVPAGYVDGDADKHGPPVAVKLDGRLPARSNAEKAQWARENRTQSSGLLGFRAI